MADSSFAQVETILKIVLPQLLNGKKEEWHRSLIVTSEVKDIAVSAKSVRIHPEYAVELGPLNACQLIIQKCSEFDQRRAEARNLHIAELRSQLKAITEKIRNVGAEFLIDETKSWPVPKHRSMVRYQVNSLPVPRHRALVKVNNE